MCRKSTGRVRWVFGLALAFTLTPGLALAQSVNAQAGPVRLDWRKLGDSTVDFFLASPATGPVNRVWYSPDGSRLFIRTADRRVFQTSDGEKWTLQPGAEVPPETPSALPANLRLPEDRAALRPAPVDPARLYAVGRQVFRSDDGGLTWAALTQYRGESIIGSGLHDLAVSPNDPEEIAVANDFGVWRSADGGLSWQGLNQSLPNLPVRRLLSLPKGGAGVRIDAEEFGALEWIPGSKRAWQPVTDSRTDAESVERTAIGQSVGATITALGKAGDLRYAGASDGRIWVSLDSGRSWRLSSAAVSGAVRGFFVDAQEPRIAIAALAVGQAVATTARVLRTTNSGQFWDDLTANLPPGDVNAVAVDRSSGSLYAATDTGLFHARADLLNPGAATAWSALRTGLPAAPVVDAALDETGDQLYVAVKGFGVFAAMAPHRLRVPRVVNAADFSARPAAPGSLLSVLGRQVDRARAGDQDMPVLAATESESQIQVPFAVNGPSLSIALETSGGRLSFGVPLREVSPAIFVDREGAPLVLDANSGILLDAITPARSGTRLQVLATGLGKVTPEWMAGLAAPLEDPPRVVAPVGAYLDREAVPVTRATLAPGYIGFYLVEIQLPKVVNAGPAELYLEADGQASNRVRVYLEP